MTRVILSRRGSYVVLLISAEREFPDERSRLAMKHLTTFPRYLLLRFVDTNVRRQRVLASRDQAHGQKTIQIC